MLDEMMMSVAEMHLKKAAFGFSSMSELLSNDMQVSLLTSFQVDAIDLIADAFNESSRCDIELEISELIPSEMFPLKKLSVKADGQLIAVINPKSLSLLRGGTFLEDQWNAISIDERMRLIEIESSSSNS